MLGRIFTLAIAVMVSFQATSRGVEIAEKDETVEAKIWTVYHNPRFGFDLPVPPAMQKKRDPDNGDGRSYHSKDGKFGLVAWGSFNVEESITGFETQWKDALEEKGRKVTYKAKGKTWFVVSGVSDKGVGFYDKVFVEGDHCAAFSITYPQAQEKEFQATIEKIAKEFKPNLGKGIDAIEPEKKNSK